MGYLTAVAFSRLEAQVRNKKKQRNDRRDAGGASPRVCGRRKRRTNCARQLPDEQPQSAARVWNGDDHGGAANEENQVVAGDGKKTKTICASARTVARTDSRRKKVASEPGQLAELGGTPVGLPACRRHTLLAGSDRERNVERSRQQSVQSVQRSGSGARVLDASVLRQQEIRASSPQRHEIPPSPGFAPVLNPVGNQRETRGTRQNPQKQRRRKCKG